MWETGGNCASCYHHPQHSNQLSLEKSSDLPCERLEGSRAEHLVIIRVLKWLWVDSGEVRKVGLTASVSTRPHHLHEASERISGNSFLFVFNLMFGNNRRFIRNYQQMPRVERAFPSATDMQSGSCCSC